MWFFLKASGWERWEAIKVLWWGAGPLINKPAISPEVNSAMVHDWIWGLLFRWHRESAEAAAGDSNWTQRICDIWAWRIFSCFVSTLLLCGYVGVSETEGVSRYVVCVWVYIDLCCSICSSLQWSFFPFAFGIESLLICLEALNLLLSAWNVLSQERWCELPEFAWEMHEYIFWGVGGGFLQVGGGHI